ncbi:MAG: hypothetical protein ACRC6P_21090 [Shewanella oncorhynchi]
MRIFVIWIASVFVVTSAFAQNINPYDFPVIDCKGCTLFEVESAVIQQAKLDEETKVAVVDAFKGKAYAYIVEKNFETTELGDGKFTIKLTPIPPEQELVDGAAQLRTILVDMWNSYSEERKDWLKEEAKKPLEINQEPIFVLGDE